MPEMKQTQRLTRITIERYRCFRDRQIARLAPLTLLVGANSTGKTSFLAILRTVASMVFQGEPPDFKSDPFDLGTFRDIVNTNGRGQADSDSFLTKLQFKLPWTSEQTFCASVTFRDLEGSPFPFIRTFSHGDVRLSIETIEAREILIRIATPRGEWDYYTPYRRILQGYFPIHFLYFFRHIFRDRKHFHTQSKHGSGPSNHDIQLITNLIDNVTLFSDDTQAIFASAPIRSRPRRTYDPARQSRDSEGEYVPNYLASVKYLRADGRWNDMKLSLGDLGRHLGLFNEISIKNPSGEVGGPFQLQVKQFELGPRETQRNLMDVGYGVSQILPVLTELLRPDTSRIQLLQQPEVHLHPTAQAALGSLFCALAADDRQLVVETHSDYLINRVRMDVRDKKTALRAEDVSILFFEPAHNTVRIHSLRIDEDGNIIDAPPSYRKFFMDEIERELGF